MHAHVHLHAGARQEKAGTCKAFPKGPSSSTVYTWALKGVPISLLWGLGICYIATWILWVTHTRKGPKAIIAHTIGLPVDMLVRFLDVLAEDSHVVPSCFVICLGAPDVDRSSDVWVVFRAVVAFSRTCELE